MRAMMSQISGVPIICSTVCSSRRYITALLHFISKWQCFSLYIYIYIYIDIYIYICILQLLKTLCFYYISVISQYLEHTFCVRIRSYLALINKNINWPKLYLLFRNIISNKYFYFSKMKKVLSVETIHRYQIELGTMCLSTVCNCSPAHNRL